MRQFIFQWIRRFRGRLAVIAGLSLLGSVTTLILPWLAAEFLSNILVGGGASLSFLIGSIVIGLSVLTAFSIASSIATETASGKILLELRKELHDHLQFLPLEFHQQNRHGDLLALLTYEVQYLSGFLASTLAYIPSQLLTASGAIMALFLIDPALALAFPLALPAFFILSKLMGRRLRTSASRVRKAENDLLELADTNLKIVSAIKSFAVEHFHGNRFAKFAENARRTALHEASLQSLLAPIAALITGLSLVLLLVIASDRFEQGQNGPKELFAFVFYAALLTRPIGDLANVYGSIRLASSTLTRVKSILGKPQEAGYAQDREAVAASGDIVFENVTFGYPNRPLLFDKFSLTIKAGSVIAITGNNGAGKSTLISLLLALYQPQSGNITVGKHNSSVAQIQSWRRQFGYVPQRSLLFNGSIQENIIFAAKAQAEKVGSLAVDRTIRLSQAEQFIRELPDGLDTIVGDNGVRLSGGQRQKVALARALLNEPPIYIFDEATSMYDDESEAAFVDACIKGLRGHTIILITHRQSSLKLADRVVSLDEKRLP